MTDELLVSISAVFFGKCLKTEDKTTCLLTIESIFDFIDEIMVTLSSLCCQFFFLDC